MYDKYLVDTHRAIAVKSWRFRFGPKNDLFWSH